MFTRKQFVPPAVVDAPGVLNALARWIISLNDKAALEISQARIYADQGIQFPATQVASSDANNLDDYEEFTWTPALTFATPGDLSVTATAYGSGVKIGNRVFLEFTYTTSVFTFTTSAGNMKITGIPFTASADANYLASGTLAWSGITKAGYTQITPRISASGTFIDFLASGSGSALGTVAAADTPSGGTIALRGMISYHV